MKKIFIGVGVFILLVIVILVATGSFKFSASIGEKENVIPESMVPEGWKKYTSGEFGYSIAHPSDWNLTDNNTQNSRDLFIMALRGVAFVSVAGFHDPSINSVTAIEASIAEYKASFENKPEELLNNFKTQINGDIGYFGADGRMRTDEAVYQFLERGMLTTDGRVLIMRGAVDTSETSLTQEAFDIHVAMVNQIMDSFNIE